jgi:hypothetical protein
MFFVSTSPSSDEKKKGQTPEALKGRFEKLFLRVLENEGLMVVSRGAFAGSMQFRTTTSDPSNKMLTRTRNFRFFVSNAQLTLSVSGYSLEGNERLGELRNCTIELIEHIKVKAVKAHLRLTP